MTTTHEPDTGLADLQALLALPEQRSIGGVNVAIREFSLADLPAIMPLVRRVMALTDEQDNRALFEALVGELQGMLQRADGMAEVCALVARFSSLPAEVVPRMRPDLLLEVVAAIVEVNAGFFAQRLVPALLRTAQSIQAVSSGLTGSGSSASLSPAGTAGPTSAATP